MYESYFKDVHKLRHDDEWRYRLLMRGVHHMLAKKKMGGVINKINKSGPIKRCKRKKVEADTWD